MGKHRRVRPSRLRQTTIKSRRGTLLLIGLSACLIAGGFSAYHALTRPLDANHKGGTVSKVEVKNPVTERDRMTLLLLGTDSRPGEFGGNSDVILVCSLDYKNKRIEVMSIPRDTKVMFPNGTYGKLNEALQVGGPVMMENLVETLLHISIDKYALTHFGGLVNVIDTIGGVTVRVPERMYFNTGDKQWNLIDLKRGVQTLNGTQALGFVRFRHDELGDVGRTMRQQEFVTALAHKLLQPENITKLPTLVGQFWSTVDTDMSLLQITGLTTQARKFQDYRIIHETLPGAFNDPSNPGEQSYWIVNAEQAKYIAEGFFFHGVVHPNPIQTEESVANWKPPTSAEALPTSSADSVESGLGASIPTGAMRKSLTQTRVSGTYANIRTGPGTEFDTIASVLKGQTVWIEERHGIWDLVKTDDGREGYIASWLLETPQPVEP